MSKKWRKRIAIFIVIVLLLFICFKIINPLPKYIRYQINNSVAELNIKGVPINSIEDMVVEHVPVRIYNTGDKKKPCVFNIPGGAFIAGNLETHDNISRYLASELDAIVISMDYRKAPENKFPRGLNDVETVLQWVFENTEAYNIDPSKIVLVGDSGGGNFSAVLALKYKENIAAQALINPALDLSEQSVAYKNWGQLVEWYLEDLLESTNKDVSPLLAPSFKGLPPTIIVTCERDPLKADGEQYKNKLERDNVKVVYENFEGLDHLGPLWAGTSDNTEEVRSFVVDEIKKVFE